MLMFLALKSLALDFFIDGISQFWQQIPNDCKKPSVLSAHIDAFGSKSVGCWKSAGPVVCGPIWNILSAGHITYFGRFLLGSTRTSIVFHMLLNLFFYQLLSIWIQQLLVFSQFLYYWAVFIPYLHECHQKFSRIKEGSFLKFPSAISQTCWKNDLVRKTVLSADCCPMCVFLALRGCLP